MRVTLETEHNRIKALCDRVETLLRTSTGPNVLFLSPVRDELASMLVQHMRFKEAMIYAPLREKARTTRLSTIEQMDLLTASLYADYGIHRRAWPCERIIAEWDGYRAATLDLLERLDRAILLERVHIYPLLTTVYSESGKSQAA